MVTRISFPPRSVALTLATTLALLSSPARLAAEVFQISRSSFSTDPVPSFNLNVESTLNAVRNERSNLLENDLSAPATRGVDKRGLRYDTYCFMGLQVSVLGLLYISPESISGWTDEQKESFSLDEWKNIVPR